MELCFIYIFAGGPFETVSSKSFKVLVHTLILLIVYMLLNAWNRIIHTYSRTEMITDKRRVHIVLKDLLLLK